MQDPIYARLGGIIRRRRDQIGMTQAELANGVGLSRTSVTNIERGRQPMLVHQLCALANILRVDVCDLVSEARVIPSNTESDGTPEFEALFGKLDGKLDEAVEGS